MFTLFIMVPAQKCLRSFVIIDTMNGYAPTAAAEPPTFRQSPFGSIGRFSTGILVLGRAAVGEKKIRTETFYIQFHLP